MQNIAFAWSGLPDYAARSIRVVIDRHPGIVRVIGTRPKVPIKGMEDSLGEPIVWVQGDETKLCWQDIGLCAPDLFFQGGYHLPAFRSLGSECRRVGGKVVGLADTSWQGNLRQFLVDPLRHAFLLRSGFDGLFVPGQSGLKYSKYVGYETSKTFAGLYGADARLFVSVERLHKRPKTFIFIGRLEPVKNLLGLVSAFKRFSVTRPDWSMHICGSGSQRSCIPPHPRMHIKEFLQPHDIAAALREARCLVLPSLLEPWGLVVHEAALSGCALALSTAVGSVPDFAEPSNSVLFKPGSVDAIEAALHTIASWDDNRWGVAEATSVRLASKFGPEIFADSVDSFIDIFG